MSVKLWNMLGNVEKGQGSFEIFVASAQCEDHMKIFYGSCFSVLLLSVKFPYNPAFPWGICQSTTEFGKAKSFSVEDSSHIWVWSIYWSPIDETKSAIVHCRHFDSVKIPYFNHLIFGRCLLIHILPEATPFEKVVLLGKGRCVTSIPNTNEFAILLNVFSKLCHSKKIFSPHKILILWHLF